MYLFSSKSVLHKTWILDHDDTNEDLCIRKQLVLDEHL